MHARVGHFREWKLMMALWGHVVDTSNIFGHESNAVSLPAVGNLTRMPAAGDKVVGG
jgi:hypothetical protein